MVVNFKVCEISQGGCKLVRTSVLIKKNNQDKHKLIQIFILIKKKGLGIGTGTKFVCSGKQISHGKFHEDCLLADNMAINLASYVGDVPICISEALPQLAIFDLTLLLDECYSFQIMTEGRQMAYQLSQGVPVACHKHLWRLFHMADAFKDKPLPQELR